MSLASFSTKDLLEIYDVLRSSPLVVQQYENQRGFLVNYEDMLEAYIQFCRNVELRIPYRWSRDENGDLYVIKPGDRDGLDCDEVKKTESVYGTIYPTYYLMIFLLAKCVFLIKNRNNIEFVNLEIDDYNIKKLNNIQMEICSRVKEILETEGEGACEKINIDKELTKMMSGILLISKLFPHFRYETLDPQFISKCLTEDTNTPNELLVERFEDKLDWKDIIENDENF